MTEPAAGTSPGWDRPVLVVVGGLPATGKSTIARRIVRRVHGAYVRVDTIEQAIKRFGATDALRDAVGRGLGYEVAYGVAADLLGEGSHVFAECVNPLRITRDAWAAVARAAGACCVQVELVCSDPVEHERRATGRTVDVPGLVLPTWREIVAREYEPWDGGQVRIDTAGRTADESVADLCRALGA